VRPFALALLVVLGAVSGCGSSKGHPPRWLEQRARAYAVVFGDPDAKLSYVLEPVPVVVLEGELQCGLCGGGAFDGGLTGRAAAIRFDPKTHAFGDSAISDGDRCAALRALGRPYANWCAKLRPERG
jgi:hypothetical protein